jgi:lambda family phage minor tail protein L
MPITTEAANLEITSPYVELFTIDITNLGVNQVWYFTPNVGAGGSAIIWKGKTYTPFPIAMGGTTANGDGSQSKPQVTVSMVVPTLLPYIVALGDLIGGKLTRYRTFAKFLDNGSNPDSTAYFPFDYFIIDQKLSHTKDAITWSMSSPIDRFGMRLPRRQVLKDGTSRNPGFPGVSRFRGNRS